MEEVNSNKKIKCDGCDKTFRYKSDLKLHRRKHIADRPFACDVCTKTFKSPGDLNVHMRVHSEVKPFQCEVCTNRYKSRGELKVHVRSHTGEKPYSCNQCGKTFSQSTNLRRHEKTHTGEKMFSCNICERSFARKQNLHNHLKLHKENKDVKRSKSDDLDYDTDIVFVDCDVIVKEEIKPEVEDFCFVEIKGDEDDLESVNGDAGNIVIDSGEIMKQEFEEKLEDCDQFLDLYPDVSIKEEKETLDHV